MLLKDKNILLGVTGSIAVYKAIELVRLYKKAGANVKVIMTSAAKKFINPLTFETISQNKVLDDTNEDWSTDSVNNHIAIGKWADLFVIAPCSANTINKLNNGIADNILTQSALAYDRIKLVAPAANTKMIKSPITQASFKMLKLCNFRFINTTTKELACQDIGDGAMAEVDTIFHASARELLVDPYWKDRMVVLNGGASIEKIDDVRYISNFSSGKMASSLALALYYKGADACFIKFKNVDFPQRNFIHTIEVDSTADALAFTDDAIRIAKKGKLSEATLMDDSTIQNIQKKPYFFGVAAISDYIPTYPQNGKIKKADIGASWSLELKQNDDILASISDNEIYKIGFKAEFDEANANSNAKNMLDNKNLDGVCLNILNTTDNNFGSDTNAINYIHKNGETPLQLASKLDLSLDLLDTLKALAND